MQIRRRREDAAEAAALRLVQEHAAELLRFARRFSHCADDAHDAYQRTIEILMRRMRSDPPAHPLSWVRTVLRHEALALRAERDELIGHVALDANNHADRAGEDPAEHVLGHERLRHTAEALRRLKPQEVTALVLRSQGLSYREICTRTSWSYTRVNRAITEGRQALRERLGAIESGAECDRWLPLLSALADGEASAAYVAELRPHLRSCPACRATLRDFHAAPARVAALVPAALVPAAAAAPDGSLVGHAGISLHGLAERATLLAARVQGAFEAVPAGKLAAVAASTAALAGGGAALEHVGDAAHASAVHARSAAPLRASAGAMSLAAASPLPQAAAQRRARAPVQGEFAPARTAPPEFARPPAGRAEFASAAGAVAGGSSVARAATATAPAQVKPPAAAPPPPSGTEFAGP